MAQQIFHDKQRDQRQTVLLMILNALIFLISTFGVILACSLATRDGYSAWYKRLLFFTQQSNIWIGALCFISALFYLLKFAKRRESIPRSLYIWQYVFTVSITVTGIIFSALLAPFADENIWTFSSAVTHIIVPVLSIITFFLMAKPGMLKFWHTALALIPPAAYVVFAAILGACHVDFGKGDPYPYFFLNFHSEVGLFGFDPEASPPELGTVYWLLFLLLFIYGLCFLYYKIFRRIAACRR